MAFFNTQRPLGPESPYEDRQWGARLQNYIEEPVNSISKEYILNFFIKNYSKKDNIQKITSRYWDYTRNDHFSRIVNNILAYDTPNTMMFFKKTSISGRMISAIASEVNACGTVQMTELTNVSLALQGSISDPIRVFKLERENNTTQYVIISSKNVTQKVYYICLGLLPNWFPELLNEIDENKLNALKALCRTIGHMDEYDYALKMQECFDLCIAPVEKEIDFTNISTLLDQNIQTRIRTLQDEQAQKQNIITDLLNRYERAKRELQSVDWELSKLTADAQEDNSEDAIATAKAFKSIVNYTYNNGNHNITIRSKMLLESDAIVKKLLRPDNYNARDHYYIVNESVRKMYEDLWLNKTLQLEFCTTFVKEPDYAVPRRARKPIWTKTTANTIPNPHLIYHNCYGDNRRQLIDANNSNNLEYYLGVLTASNSNLNTGDATVLSRFCQDMLDKYWNEPILYDVEAKVYVSPKERVASYETVQTN